MFWSFVYAALCRILQFLLLLLRSDRAKEIEILVLRHVLRKPSHAAALASRPGQPQMDLPSQETGPATHQ